MVAVDPTGKGNLQAFPVGAGTGAGLSVNYNTIDTNLANAGTVMTVTGSGADITVASNFLSAHTAIDVLGYYYPASSIIEFREYILNVNQIVICAPEYMVWTLVFQILYIQGSRK